MEKSSTQLVRPLTVKYAIALGLLAALAGANFYILRMSIDDSEGLVSIVNDAGRQRMLLHRTAILSERFVFAVNDETRQKARTELLADVHGLEQTHHELMSLKTSRRQSVTAEVTAIYEDAPWLLDSEMRNYLLHVRSLADAPENELNFTNPHFAYIRNSKTIDGIRDGLEAVVDIYESRSDAKTRQLHLLAIWSFASTLTLLLLDGWLVFRPMVRQVRDDVIELNHWNETLEQRVAERTAELANSEAALRDSEALYSSLVHHMPMCMLRKDRNGRFTFANEQFCELMEQPLEEIVGRSDDDLYAPELAKKYRDDDLRVMDAGCVLQDVERHRGRDGRELFVEVLKVPLLDAEGGVVGTQTMFWDVTDRKQAEQRAFQSERLAAIGQMVTGVAHESRNALQQIQACSQLLKWELEGDVDKISLLDDLQRAEERLLRTFNELRSYAAPVNLDPVPCDIRDVVEESWAATELDRAGRDVRFKEIGSHVSTKCIADPYQLQQVFRNLFENALAACDDPVAIEVEFTENGDIREDGESTLRITISDNGPGLSPEQQTRLFEPFFTTKTEGTGLGMAIVKRIVDAHRGTITAHADGTTGATLRITLPRGALPTQPTWGC